MPNSATWSIRHLPYMPEGFDWRVSQFDSSNSPTSTFVAEGTNGFYDKATAEKLAGQLNS